MSHWFKLYSDELMGDPKLARIAATSGFSLPEVRAGWVALLCLANDSPTRGLLLMGKGLKYTRRELAKLMGFGACRGEKLLDCYLNAGNMLAEKSEVFAVLNWKKRQPNPDNSRDRVKKWRESRSKQPPVTALRSVTQPLRNGAVTVLDKDIDVDMIHETTEKGSAPAPDPVVDECLSVLRGIPGWPPVKKEDIPYVERQREEFTGVNVAAVARDLEGYYRTKTIKKTDNPWLRFRNWVRIQHERNEEKSSGKAHSEQISDTGAGRSDRGAKANGPTSDRERRQAEYIAQVQRSGTGGTS